MQPTIAIIGSLTAVYNYFAKLVIESGLTPQWGSIVWWCVLVVIYLGSPFLSATISESKGHGILLHFIGGLVFPYLYPIIIHFALPSRLRIHAPQEPEEEEVKPTLTVTSARQKSERMASESAEVEFEATAPAFEEEGNDAPVIGQQFFTSISVTETGVTRQGPFMVEMDDGTVIEAQKIVKPQEKIVVLEIQGEAGTSRTLRIPYSKIVDCKLKSDWMGGI